MPAPKKKDTGKARGPLKPMPKKETALRKAEVKAIKSGSRAAQDPMTMSKTARNSSQLNKEFNQGYVSGKQDKARASRSTATSAPAKRTPGVYPKGLGVSTINPDAQGSNRQKYLDAVQTIRETSETRKDVWDAVSMIAAAGRKYKQDPTKDIANWKKFVKKVTPEAADKRWK